METRSAPASMQISHEISFADRDTGTSTLGLYTPTFQLAHHLANDLGGSLRFSSVPTPAMAGNENDFLDDEWLAGGDDHDIERHVVCDERVELRQMPARY